MISTLFDADIIDSKAAFKKDILAREEQGTTGLGMEIAIPHAKSKAVKKPAVLFGRSAGVDWDSLDGTDAKLIFMIAVPEAQAGDTHLKILQMLSRKLMNDDYRQQLLQAETKLDAYKLLSSIEDEG